MKPSLICKKSNYVKRCVGIAGDSLQIKDGFIYINGKQTVLLDRAKPQFFYTVDTKGKQLNLKRFIKKFYYPEGWNLENGNYFLNLTEEAATYLKKYKGVISVTKKIDTAGIFKSKIFPHSKQYPWSIDNYGPIYIPEAGKTVVLNTKTLPFYKRIIEIYEHNTLEEKEGQIIINGKKADTYTFNQNYYWMMGDNRHNSEDARFWGFVPFDHVVGKPVFIWFSIEQSKKPFLRRIRWDRVFTTVHASGEPKSYLWHVIAFSVLLWGFSFFRKKRKA